MGMYLRTTQRRNKDGSVVRYLALAENVRHPEKGYVEAKVVHSFGRADQLDRGIHPARLAITHIFSRWINGLPALLKVVSFCAEPFEDLHFE